MRKSVKIKILRHHHIKNMKSTSAPGEHLQKAIKNQSKIVSRRILRPESNRVIRFTECLLLLPAEPKTFPILRFLNPHPLTPSSTVRTSLKQVNTPFRRAESNGGVRLAVRPLVLEAEAKTFPILPFLNPHPLTPSSTFRTPLERVDTPIRCAESTRTIRFALSLLLSPVEAKTSPILPFLNHH